MKIRVLALGLCFSSSAAFAGWTKLYKNGDEVTYIDYSTVLVRGNVRDVWEIWDKEEKQCVNEGCYRSTRVLVEYDCVAITERFLFLIGHTESMGNGEIMGLTKGTDLGDKGEPQSITPGTNGFPILKRVCDIKS